jgi:hypothetical protein
MRQGVQKLTVNQLSESERADLEKTFGTARFVSDEDEAALWFILPLFAGLAGIGVGIVHYEEFIESLTLIADHPSMLPYLFINLPFLAALAGFLACGFDAWYFLRVHGRHGHAVTSFGVVQVRGPSLRVLRYEHIASISQRRFRVAWRRATETTFTAKDGTRLATYATSLVDTIRARSRISV